MIRVLVADDHPVVSGGVAAALRAEPDITVVAVTAQGDTTLERAREGAIDVSVVDLQMPGVDGVELVRSLSDLGIAVVVFSLYADGPMAANVLAAGARWAVPKTAALTDLVAAVRAASRGDLMPTSASADPVATLSLRERDIFARIVSGSPLKVIAIDLGLSTGTVHTFAHRIRTKLGVETISDIVRFAHDRGLHLRR